MVTKVLDTALDRALIGYSNVGYLARRRAWGPLPRLDGKVVLVTGAKAGLGRAIADGLARQGAEVHVAVRGDAELPFVVHTLDVSLLAEVRAFADAWEGPLHAVVHNAGVMPPERGETSEGHELTLATHVLGPHLLTKRLPAHRSIWVSSGGMYASKLVTDDLEYRRSEYKGVTAYARTKRMQVVLAGEWAKRGQDASSAHPGWVDTPGIADSLPLFKTLTRPILRTPEQGADTFVWLAGAEVPSGRFWHDRAPRPEHYLPSTRESEQDRRTFWDAVEALSEASA
jgi:NAD(P)-dependent dehydrogenase (short-subunit alcohol dehydrogenase family)